MSEAKVKVFTTSGQSLGYFVNPQLVTFPDGGCEISGHFYDSDNKVPAKIEFNPESLPYTADLSELASSPHKRLTKVYVQRSRQPIRMSGVGMGNS